MIQQNAWKVHVVSSIMICKMRNQAKGKQAHAKRPGADLPPARRPPRQTFHRSMEQCPTGSDNPLALTDTAAIEQYSRNFEVVQSALIGFGGASF
jgi:hypothetical protein